MKKLITNFKKIRLWIYANKTILLIMERELWHDLETNEVDLLVLY